MADRELVTKALAKADYFRQLPPDYLTRLASICWLKKLKKRELLFSEGQEGFGFFLLLKGAIKVFRTSEAGKEVVIRLIKPGEVFGEVILFEEKIYPANARAIQDSTVLIIPKKQIYELLEKKPFRHAFIGMLFKKLHYLNQRLFMLTLQNVPERFFSFLITQYGKRDQYVINISKKEIAETLGIKPETFSRLLAELQRQEKIAWHKKQLMVYWERIEKPLSSIKNLQFFDNS